MFSLLLRGHYSNHSQYKANILTSIYLVSYLYKDLKTNMSHFDASDTNPPRKGLFCFFLFLI